MIFASAGPRRFYCGLKQPEVYLLYKAKPIKFIGLQARQHKKYCWWVSRIQTFFSILGNNILESNVFLVSKEEKIALVSVQSIYSLCNKMEEHS